MPNRDIIVIGASNGGTEPMIQIVKELSPNLRASVFIVRHLPAEGHNYLVDILARVTSLAVASAGHCQAIRKNAIYIAPPNRHLLINLTQTYLSSGPRENLCRPAIDPLFRSAAAAAGPRVIGIILSGELDDGTAGLHAVKQCGGVTIVQDPAVAIAPSMPESAAHHVAIDHSLSPAKIGVLLNELAGEAVPSDFQCPDEVKKELGYLVGMREGIDALADDGRLVPVGCPSCGGPLWELSGELPRYRCHIGHAFTGQSVLHGLKDVEEQALFAALRSLEERARMLRKLDKDRQSEPLQERLRETEAHTQQLRNLLGIFDGQLWKC